MYPNKYIYECRNINHKHNFYCPLCFTNLCFNCHNEDIIFCLKCKDFLCSQCYPYLLFLSNNVKSCPVCLKNNTKK